VKLKYCLILFIAHSTLSAQSISSKSIVEKSINYHDPEGLLSKGNYTFSFEESRPDGTINKSSVSLSPYLEQFKVSQLRNDDSVEYIIDKKEVSFLVNNNATAEDSLIKKYRLTNERAIMMKNYYLYLWHLPMKLNDPGTIVDDKHKIVDFFGQNLIELKVTYEKKVGNDIWYFYFEPKSYKLSGYRFYHNEKDNDGEYILLDGEVSLNSIRLPATRKWYTHKEDKFLGTDKLVRITEIN